MRLGPIHVWVVQVVPRFARQAGIPRRLILVVEIGQCGGKLGVINLSASHCRFHHLLFRIATVRNIAKVLQFLNGPGIPFVLHEPRTLGVELFIRGLVSGRVLFRSGTTSEIPSITRVHHVRGEVLRGTHAALLPRRTGPRQFNSVDVQTRSTPCVPRILHRLTPRTALPLGTARSVWLTCVGIAVWIGPSTTRRRAHSCPGGRIVSFHTARGHVSSRIRVSDRHFYLPRTQRVVRVIGSHSMVPPAQNSVAVGIGREENVGSGRGENVGRGVSTGRLSNKAEIGPHPRSRHSLRCSL